MATKLEKAVTRESSTEIDGRNIMVTLTPDQKIQFKLKGLKSGVVSIDIEKLYCQLTDCDVESEEKIKDKSKGISIVINQPKSGTKDNPMISLYDLRSKNAISGLDYQTLSKFDGIIKGLIDEMKSKPLKKK